MGELKLQFINICKPIRDFIKGEYIDFTCYNNDLYTSYNYGDKKRISALITKENAQIIADLWEVYLAKEPFYIKGMRIISNDSKGDKKEAWNNYFIYNLYCNGFNDYWQKCKNIIPFKLLKLELDLNSYCKTMDIDFYQTNNLFDKSSNYIWEYFLNLGRFEAIKYLKSTLNSENITEYTITQKISVVYENNNVTNNYYSVVHPSTTENKEVDTEEFLLNNEFKDKLISTIHKISKGRDIGLLIYILFKENI